jgi:hypothetical protein
VQVIGIVSLVRDDRFGFDAFDQGARLGDIVALARSEQQADGIAERIGGGVDFGAQPAPRAA